MLRFVAVICAIVMMACTGCEQAVESAADDTPASDVSQWQFASPEQFVQHVAGLDDERRQVGFFEHMYGRTLEEQWAVQYHGAAAEAEVEYRVAVRKQFGDDAESITTQPMELLSLPASTEDAHIETHGDSRVRIRFEDAAGDEHVIVLANIRGLWTPHATSILDGEDILPSWCNTQRSYYEARIKFYRDVAESIRQGQYNSPEQAVTALRRLLTGPPPPRGSVQPD